MSIEIRRTNNAPEVIPEISKNVAIPAANPNLSIPNPKPSIQLSPNSVLEVPSFMQSSTESIRKLSEKERYIEQMKFLASKYPQQLKREAGKFLNNRRVTLAETGYRYFMEEVEIGAGLSIEVNFSDDSLREISNHYLRIFS